MPTIRPEVSQLLAENWHSLPHEDGRPRRLMHMSQFGRDDDTKKRIQILGRDLGDCVQTLFHRKGFSIIHEDDPIPADADNYKQGAIKCARCGKQLLTIGFNKDMIANFQTIALKNITQINPNCPHD